jgi:hypothetical protein
VILQTDFLSSSLKVHIDTYLFVLYGIRFVL